MPIRLHSGQALGATRGAAGLPPVEGPLLQVTGGKIQWFDLNEVPAVEDEEVGVGYDYACTSSVSSSTQLNCQLFAASRN